IEADLLVVCTHGDPAKDALYRLIDQTLGGHLSTRAKAEEFAGKPGQVLYSDRGVGAAGALAVIGAGDLDGFDPGKLRDMTAGAARLARRVGARRVALALPPLSSRQVERAVQLAAEGLLLGSYRFVQYRGEEARKPSPVEEVVLTSERGKPGKKGKSSAPQ